LALVHPLFWASASPVLARDNFAKVAKQCEFGDHSESFDNFTGLSFFPALRRLSGTAPAADSPETAAMLTIRAEAIGAHVKFLADDLLEGHGTGMCDGIVSSVAAPSWSMVRR
jgi:hypothetical protein